jgi:cytochrome c oxidase subunit 3
MKWFAPLRVKPWLPREDRPELQAPHGLAAISGPRLGLAIFLIVISVLFLLFTISYQLRLDYQDWRPMADPWQLWMNTAFLLGGSVALQMANSAARHSQWPRATRLLTAAGAMTLAFLVGQLWAWSVMVDAGYTVGSNPANSFFYLITGVHGAHIVGGLVAWLRIIPRLRTGNNVESIRLSIQLCTTYWHFLFVIWLFLFYMLLVT